MSDKKELPCRNGCCHDQHCYLKVKGEWIINCTCPSMNK